METEEEYRAARGAWVAKLTALGYPVAYRVVADGEIWDYSTHRVDVERWRDKILSEEPDTHVEIQEADLTDMYDWKSA